VPNGVIQNYRLVVIPPRGSPSTIDQGLATAMQLLVLPYSTYRFTLSACTNGGCTSSTLTSFSTPEDVPQNQSAPVSTSLSNGSIALSWSPPDASNGVVLEYQLWMRLSSQARIAREAIFRDTDIREAVFRRAGFPPLAMT